jgi:hypothetical protein
VFLARVARLPLSLSAAHPDGAGGLAFLGEAHIPYALLSFAVSSVVTAEAARAIAYQGATIRSFQGLLVVTFAIVIALFLAPLLVFTIKLVRVRRLGFYSYGCVGMRYSQDFERKWVEGAPPVVGDPDDEILGTSHIQSLADLANVYDRIAKMRVFVFGRTTVLAIVGAAVLPMLTLAAVGVPVVPIIKQLAHALV